jgi:urea transport system permease protein
MPLRWAPASPGWRAARSARWATWGPDLGQGYIVDSFMVVVLGGVGQLAGTVYAGLGLGILNKLLEGWQGAVLAKIMVLAFIVIFIQKRPQGLFA